MISKKILNKKNLLSLIRKSNYKLKDNIELVYINKNKNKINTIESIHANNTNRDIDSNIKSQNVIVSANNGLLEACVAAVLIA